MKRPVGTTMGFQVSMNAPGRISPHKRPPWAADRSDEDSMKLGRADAAAGQVHSQEDVAKWLSRWGEPNHRDFKPGKKAKSG